ncbi:PKD domain-containing protein [Methanophagales archaeon]|nr:MAG: PKD domain-containing protein [Methanophagales archaeon]
MKSKEFTYFILAFASVILVNTASAAINITDADAIYEVNLSTVSVPTSPVPIKTVFVINADTSLDQNLSHVSIPTQPSPLKEIFIINEDAALKKNLSTVSIPTEPLPVKEIFIHLEDAEYFEELLFPKELINDTTPPIITNITVTNITYDSATIKWDTDEFADSLVKYGTSSGAYTKQEYDELFVKNHSVSLYNLSPGTKYYFVVKSVDLSGNSVESSEYSFTTSGTLNQPPIASFTYSPEKPVVNQPVTFDASSSYDPDGNITSYEWDFGDGNVTSTTHEILNHSYSEAGSYEVTLTVTDDDGVTNSTTKEITVYPSTAIFDTGAPSNPYPSISGTHSGTITPNQTITISTLYTYPCAGTGGHTEYARIWNSTLDVNATWNGYVDDWHNISFNEPFTLVKDEVYNYTIRTGSYPQIHHNTSLLTPNGWINCTKFIDANGKVYYDWIPAIKLS